MRSATIRPMAAADVEPAARLLARGDWGPFEARLAFFAFAVGAPFCAPLVAEREGDLVGTGVGTVNGEAGWVGTIYVAPSDRGRGLGHTLTDAVVHGLEAAGCRTLVLVATELGRPIYDRLGFQDDGWYVTHERTGTATEPGEPAGVRLRAEDLPAIAELDRAATGEDRAALLGALLADAATVAWATPTPTATGADVAAFVIRPPWPGGATIARDPDAAASILGLRLRLAGPERRVRVGVHSSNAAGLAWLSRSGWTEAWRGRRMVRGRPLAWQPSMIWGQLNFALG